MLGVPALFIFDNIHSWVFEVKKKNVFLLKLSLNWNQGWNIIHEPQCKVKMWGYFPQKARERFFWCFFFLLLLWPLSTSHGVFLNLLFNVTFPQSWGYLRGECRPPLIPRAQPGHQVWGYVHANPKPPCTCIRPMGGGGRGRGKQEPLSGGWGAGSQDTCQAVGGEEAAGASTPFLLDLTYKIGVQR